MKGHFQLSAPILIFRTHGFMPGTGSGTGEDEPALPACDAWTPVQHTEIPCPPWTLLLQCTPSGSQSVTQRGLTGLLLGRPWSMGSSS